MMKRYFLYAIFFATPLFASGQARISDIHFKQHGDTVVITYHLDLNESRKLKNVMVYMSIDGGEYRQLHKVSGDVGTVKSSGTKKIFFNIFKEFVNEEISGDISFKVEGTPVYIEPKYFVEYTYSTAAPIGFMMGYCKQWGGYIKLKTGLGPKRDAIVTIENSSNVDFDKKEYYRVSVMAGATRRLFNSCYLYGGLGYGEYGAAYPINGVYYCPDLIKGLEAEAGVLFFIWKNLTISVGYATTVTGNQKLFTDNLNLGIGIKFQLEL